MEFVQELLRPFVSELGEVREVLGAERARRQAAEERTASLEAELKALREVRESPETVEEAPEGAPAPSGTGGAQEGLRRPDVASGMLGNAAILLLFLLGLLLVSGTAAFDAYMYEDPAFGPFVSVLPITPLVAGACGGIAGYVAGRRMHFSRFLLGGGIMGLAATAVAHFASVMVTGRDPANWGRSFFAMGLVLVSTWAVFAAGAYIGKVILMGSGEERVDRFKSW